MKKLVDKKRPISANTGATYKFREVASWGVYSPVPCFAALVRIRRHYIHGIDITVIGELAPLCFFYGRLQAHKRAARITLEATLYW